MIPAYICFHLPSRMTFANTKLLLFSPQELDPPWILKLRWTLMAMVMQAQEQCSLFLLHAYWLLLLIAFVSSSILCSQIDSLHSCCLCFWMSDYPFIKYPLKCYCLKYPLKWCTDSGIWLLHGWCHVKLLPSQHKFCVHHTIMHKFIVLLHSKPHGRVCVCL